MRAKRGITHGDICIWSHADLRNPGGSDAAYYSGVVAMQAGARWQPDENGADSHGCANVPARPVLPRKALAKEIHIKPCWWEVAKA